MKIVDSVSLVASCVAGLLLAACTSLGGAPEAPARNVSGVESEMPASLPEMSGPISSPVVLHASYAIATALDSDVRVNGVAAGNLDPSVPGDEIVAVDLRGRVHVMTREGDGFRHEMIATTGGELVQVAVGDLMPSVPGDEIVAVGAESGTEDDEGPGVIRIFHRGAGNGWVETSYLAPSLVHAIAIGSLRSGESASFVCAGFFQQALIGKFERSADSSTGADGVSLSIAALDLPPVGNAKGLALTTEGFVMAFDDGHTVEFVATPEGYSHRSPVPHGSPLARIAYDPEVGVLLCDNDGFLRVFPLGDRPASKVLERAKQRLRGAVFVDIDPKNEGVEACSAGYDGLVRVVDLNRIETKQLELPGQPVTQGWDGRLRYVARDSAKVHHLTSGDIHGFGTCLITCGYSGDVLLIHRQDLP